MSGTVHRLFCYNADLMLMTGKSERTCQRILQSIRDCYCLEKHQLITVFNVCDYFGISLDKLLPFLR